MTTGEDGKVFGQFFMNALVDSSVTSILEHTVAQQKKMIQTFLEGNES